MKICCGACWFKGPLCSIWPAFKFLSFTLPLSSTYWSIRWLSGSHSLEKISRIVKCFLFFLAITFYVNARVLLRAMADSKFIFIFIYLYMIPLYYLATLHSIFWPGSTDCQNSLEIGQLQQINSLFLVTRMTKGAKCSVLLWRTDALWVTWDYECEPSK